MKGLDLKKLVRPLVLKIAPYRSARDEFEDFEAQNIFLDANENPFDTWSTIDTLTHNRTCK